MSTTIKGQRALQQEVTQTPFCTGCGACINLCAYHAACHDEIIMLHGCDIEEGRCYAYCPRTPTDFDLLRKVLFDVADLTPEIGAVRNFCITRAADEFIRAGAQHGGTVTALLILAMKEGLIDSAVTAGKSENLLPKGVTMNSPDEIAANGKTSFVVSPNVAEFNALAWTGGRKIGIAATPCQALALAKMRAKPVAAHAGRVDQLKLVIGLFCGWALSWEKLSALLQKKRINPKNIIGMDVLPSAYQLLQLYTKKGAIDIPLAEIDPDCVRDACRYCTDMTAEFSDISVGSTRLPEGWEAAKGWNQVIARTAIGEQLLDLARTRGVLEFRDVPGGNLDRLKIAAARKRNKAAKSLAAYKREGAEATRDLLSFGKRAVSAFANDDFVQDVISPLIKAVLRRDDLTMVLNSLNYADAEEPNGDIAKACKMTGARVKVQDAFDFEGIRSNLGRMTAKAGVNVLILKQSFHIDSGRKEKKEYNISISETLCLGEQCGCNRMCTRIFRCPGLVWDKDHKKPRIVEDICTGCGACSLVCTTGAIVSKKIA